VRAQAQRDQSAPRAGGDRRREARYFRQGRRRRAGQGRHHAPRQGRRTPARHGRTEGQGRVFGLGRFQVRNRRGGEGGRLGRNSRAQAGRGGRKSGLSPI